MRGALSPLPLCVHVVMLQKLEVVLRSVLLTLYRNCLLPGC